MMLYARHYLQICKAFKIEIMTFERVSRLLRSWNALCKVWFSSVRPQLRGESRDTIDTIQGTYVNKSHALPCKWDPLQ
jgi:hypothetical protein